MESYSSPELKELEEHEPLGKDQRGGYFQEERNDGDISKKSRKKEMGKVISGEGESDSINCHSLRLVDTASFEGK